ncbi:MAG TPA: hypothetical protein VG735_10685 [Caulobacterales bacterium]|nr:hypothetical protein [Caulobacterales bacterium]
MSTIEFAIVGLIFVGASAAMVRAVLLRHEAVAAWRRAIGANFDASQHRFATYLDLDRARLPPEAQAKLRESHRALFAGGIVGIVAAVLLVWVTATHV